MSDCIDAGNEDSTASQVQLGVWLIAGLFAFALLERLLTSTADCDDKVERAQNSEDEDSDTQNNNDPGEKKKDRKKKSAEKHGFSLMSPFRGMTSHEVFRRLNM